MQALTWQEGGSGTIQCSDGHVHIKGIRDRERFETALRRFVDDAPRLPAPIAYFSAALTKAGSELSSFNQGMFSFGDLPEDWLERYEGVTATAVDESPVAEQPVAPVSPPTQAEPAATKPSKPKAERKGKTEKAAKDPHAGVSDEDLRELATAAGVEGATDMNREQLIAAIDKKS